MLKKCLIFALLLALCLGLTPARGEQEALGNPFPDFTVETTDGETFTLSEVLKEKQAVLINLWASWCPPCRNEFPYLDEAWAQRADKVAVIALSIEKDDTLDAIADFKKELGLSLPMGRDEEAALAAYVEAYYIPTTVVVDRFGNACFLQSGALPGTDAFLRLMDYFLGEDYTESRVLRELPPARDWQVTGDGVREAGLIYRGQWQEDLMFVAQGKKATLRFASTAGDASGDFLYNEYLGNFTLLEDIYSPDEGAYVYETEVPGEGDCIVFRIFTPEGEQTLYLILTRGEEGADGVVQQLKDAGYTMEWAYRD